ncbi:MAG: TIR domain-containing protein [Aggregatilineales bacterium]
MNTGKFSGKTFGAYQLKNVISDAGLVVTYLAHQPALKRDVAIQLLDPYYNDEFGAGFQKAAEIAASLDHAHIVPTHDYIVDDDLAGIVTAYMRGGILRNQMQNGALSVTEIATLINHIARAQDFAHSRDVVHGDPSAANIAFDDAGNAYIADFHVAGIAMMSKPAVSTPFYSAPERLIDETVSPKTDQYALASVAYRLLTHQHPYFGEEFSLPMMLKIHEATFIPPSMVNSMSPALLDAVFARALAIQPDDRYPSVIDFARAFESALANTDKHLFISYSRRDTAYAQSLKTYLRENNFNVWIDDNIEHGDQWFNKIHEAIKDCAAFVIVMSPEAESSEWVQKEVLLAKRYQKPIFPLLLNGQEFAILIDIQFGDVRDKSMPGINFLRRLRRSIYGIV